MAEENESKGSITFRVRPSGKVRAVLADGTRITYENPAEAKKALKALQKEGYAVPEAGMAKLEAAIVAAKE